MQPRSIALTEAIRVAAQNSERQDPGQRSNTHTHKQRPQMTQKPSPQLNHPTIRHSGCSNPQNPCRTLLKDCFGDYKCSGWLQQSNSTTLDDHCQMHLEHSVMLGKRETFTGATALAAVPCCCLAEHAQSSTAHNATQYRPAHVTHVKYAEQRKLWYMPVPLMVCPATLTLQCGCL
jgi:hypothetical protein